MIQTYLRDQLDWDQPFKPEEYADRRRRVREALQAAGLDAIYITNPADLTWLTNYDMIWYHL
ncbi:MAG: aminopeptidase P family N-terminal domain-containing protein, partial [Alphaproteobacteria bacterium]|nr:aminopeptidase P family N-terminal domain-containing protein [Alphaproteobacteria bacterium]